MITRLFALFARIARRFEGAADFSAQLRSDSLAAGNVSGLSAAAATRW